MIITKISIPEDSYQMINKELKLGKNIDLKNECHRICFKKSVKDLFREEEKERMKKKFKLTAETMELDRTIVYIVVKNPMVLGKYPLYQLGLGYFKCGDSIEHENCCTFLIGLDRLAKKNNFDIKKETEKNIKKWEGRFK